MPSPTSVQCRVVAPGCVARQPTSIATVHPNTSGGSMVIKIEPMPSSGTAVTASRRKKPARALTSREMKRNTARLIMAAKSGEKKRTPKALSPNRDVPANWMKAMPGGLL